MKKITTIIALISFIITIDFDARGGYQYQFLLPGVFLFTYILLAPPFKSLGIGYQVLNIIWIIRYCLTPVLIRISDYQFKYYNNITSNDMNIALIVMILEMIIFIFSCNLIYRRLLRKSRISKLPRNMNNIILENNKTFKSVSATVIGIMFLLLILVLVLDPNAITGFNFILSDNFQGIGNASLGISVLIVSWTKITITVFLIAMFGVKDNTLHNPLNFWCSIIIVLISISIFNGTSRNEVLIESLAYVYMLTQLFPKYRKRTIIICIGGLFSILLSMTIVRFFNTTNINEGLSNFNISNVIVLLNSYFAGQQNIAIGVINLRLFFGEYHILTIVKDLFTNTILLSNYVSKLDGLSTVEMFNFTIYGHSLWADQISPTITQAIGLFNIFSIFIPFILVYFIFKMDIISKNTSNIFGIFLAAFIAVNIAFYSPGNITILSTAITNRFIPLFIIYKMSSIYLKRKEKGGSDLHKS